MNSDPTQYVYQYVDAELEEEKNIEQAELTTLLHFQFVDIPKKSCFARSHYFHKAMLLIEEKLIVEKAKTKTIERLDLAQNFLLKLEMFHRYHRMSIDKEHRLILFCLIARLTYCTSNYNLKEEQEDHEQCKSMLSKHIAVSSSDVYTLWRTVKLTFNSFYCKRYSAVLKRHIYRLYLRCCTMCVSQTRNSDMMNHPLFCDLDKSSQMWHVNKKYMEECDQIFANAFVVFRLYDKCVAPMLSRVKNSNDIEQIDFDPLCKRQLLKWIFDNVKDNFLPPAEEEFQKMIYDLNVNPGETEKFKNEDRLAEPSPYNVIAKYRRPRFDDLLNIFEGETPLNDLVTKYLTQNLQATPDSNDDAISDVQLISMCIPMLNYLFSRIYPGCPRFLETFLIQRDDLCSNESGTVRLLKLIERHKAAELDSKRNAPEFPRFVFVFNEYYILSGSRFYKCKDFLAAYLQWLRLCSFHERLMAVPVEKINLFDQFKLFFPQETEQIDKLAKRHEKKITSIREDLGLPTNYNASSQGRSINMHRNKDLLI